MRCTALGAVFLDLWQLGTHMESEKEMGDVV